ncbi:TPA: type I-F CRISPR-associated helicase Cas3 [Enterobacter hormaechei subsp. xiangfangensis]|nr:type I-F CRISPR-associated helicase Cas3 [Enterobacter hormaechei subsp. xiangfangensis]
MKPQTVPALAAGLAGLFHDWGKASALFQQGLTGDAPAHQPQRHEFVSLRLFAAFVGGREDSEWLAALAAGDYSTENILAQLDAVGVNPLADLPPFASLVAWLIVSHHRMPTYWGQGDNEPSLKHIDNWRADSFAACWGYENAGEDFTAEQIAAFNDFPHGLPSDWAAWRELAARLGKRALKHPSALHGATGRFVAHTARLALMLADHYVSGLPAAGGGALWANTDRNTGALRQSLEYHLIAVARAALLICRNLHRAPALMPSISDHAGLAAHTDNPRFTWQNAAYDATANRDNVTAGFFGLSLASTGCGKTFANARIMYALAPDRCRFSVALGLRTLTLQTGDALREKLNLTDADLAVAVGGAGVRQLHELRHAGEDNELSDDCYVKYAGELAAPGLQRLAGVDKSFNKLLSAPVLVSTIDHLMPASESLRGGRQIAPLLRLLTSDLVLDEPDDFDVADQYALCRLVNFAGLCGSRVLLSSATIPPALAMALFGAYRAGRKDYATATGADPAIQCGWFDEHAAIVSDVPNSNAYKEQLTEFCDGRIFRLRGKTQIRRGAFIEVSAANRSADDVITSVAHTINHGAMLLHGQHHQQHRNGKRVSVGLVRFANIKTLAAVARVLMSMPAAPGYRFHFCVYHSQHPLLMRSHIESRLDATLTRYDSEAIYDQPEVAAALQQPEENQVFITLATSVAEVGRDHDYDWSIAEPSSMRSLIQLAGRVQRHRQRVPESPNLLVMSSNIRAMRKPAHLPAYCMPGFETDRFMLPSHDVRQLIEPEHIDVISSVPRLHRCGSALADLEHYRTSIEMLHPQEGARIWWTKPADWCGELQRRWPFRKSSDDEMTLHLAADGLFYAPDSGEMKESGDVDHVELTLAPGNQIWFEADPAVLIHELAAQLNMSTEEVSRRFGEITLRTEGSKFYNPALGVFGELE